ncbi:phosphoserine phosphatase SerB [Methanocaldococcus infernus]|uniref:phosphoserine phosphatase n=1 Tax=Methanocaldococcus infernus (strain DSM 11812 / JCM 15783 / ME) TaxID=573063 RepID=D5VS50_METIM|nr:phosphoserine phosphatase SerB [Methanocaldococcus infernus]ADG13403.1 phosphoserine phosphatase SerB [Methanocaldococcus infernus ME]
MRKKIIFFDFDSTLINNETIDELAKEAGVEREVKEITKKAMRGEIDFKEALKERVKLLKGLPLEKVNEAIERLTLTEGAEETIKELKKKGYIVAVISGGFDIALNKFKDKLNIDYSFGNTLIVKDNKLTGEVEEKVIDKGEVVENLVKELKIPKENIVVVGDGANDIAMFEKAGLRIAFCAKPILKEKADICIEKRDLKEILKYVK